MIPRYYLADLIKKLYCIDECDEYEILLQPKEHTQCQLLPCCRLFLTRNRISCPCLNMYMYVYSMFFIT